MDANKNYKSFQGKGHIEKEACPLYRLLEHAYEKWNLYELNKEHLTSLLWWSNKMHQGGDYQDFLK